MRAGRRALSILRPGARCAAAGPPGADPEPAPMLMPPPAGAPKVGGCVPDITPTCVVVKLGTLPPPWPPKLPLGWKGAAAAGWELPAEPGDRQAACARMMRLTCRSAQHTTTSGPRQQRRAACQPRCGSLQEPTCACESAAKRLGAAGRGGAKTEGGCAGGPAQLRRAARSPPHRPAAAPRAGPKRCACSRPCIDCPSRS